MYDHQTIRYTRCGKHKWTIQEKYETARGNSYFCSFNGWLIHTSIVEKSLYVKCKRFSRYSSKLNLKVCFKKERVPYTYCHFKSLEEIDRISRIDLWKHICVHCWLVDIWITVLACNCTRTCMVFAIKRL